MASGAVTLTQAIDQAVKSFLERGINCIEYKDGRRVNIATYAEMALRAAGIRSYLRGEGQRRKELGLLLVICNVNDSACAKCVPWDAEILIDDVWSGGRKEDHPGYKLLSEAIDKGFLHPNCEDGISTYIPGITKPHAKVDPKKAAERYKAGQKQREIERQIRRFKRLAEGTASPEEVKEHKAKVRQWQAEMRDYLAQNPQLRREYRREKIYAEHGALSAGKIGDSDGNSHIAKISQIDYNDDRSVKEAYEQFAELYKGSDTEHAIVISPSGQVYEIDGWSASVNIELAGRDALKDSLVIHNHPDEYGAAGDSFSKADFAGLLDYGIRDLRVVTSDMKYRMGYQGAARTREQAESMYEQAKMQATEDAMDGLADPDRIQHETMLRILQALEGLLYEEW